MKKILKSIAVALLGIAMASGLNSCEIEGAKIGERQIITQEGDTVQVEVRKPAFPLRHVSFRGHDYLESNFASSTSSGSYSIMHDPDCRAFKCK